MWKFLVFIILSVAFTSNAKLDTEREPLWLCHDTAGVSISIQNDELDFSTLYSGLTSLASGMFMKQNVKLLMIHADDLANCSPNILDIEPASLEALSSAEIVNIVSVKLHGVESPFKGFKSLRELMMIGNNLTTLPKQFLLDAPNLKVLTLARQSIRTLSDDSCEAIPEGLEDLTMQRTQLHDLSPRCFHRLHQLINLSLPKNHLTHLNSDMFVGLDQLQLLDLNENHLTSVEFGTFSMMTDLRTLLLAMNRLESLPYGIFDRLVLLERLALQDNPLKYIPDNFVKGLPQLTDLSLGFGENVKIDAGALNSLTLNTLTLKAEDWKAIEVGTFNGTATKNLALYRKHNEDFRRNVFRGLTTNEVSIYEDKMGKIKKQRWGLAPKVPVYSASRARTYPFKVASIRYKDF